MAEAIHHQQVSYQGHLETVGPDHLGTLMAWHNVSRLRAEVGEFEQAKGDLRQVLSRTIVVYGELHPFCLYAKHNLARAFWFEGDDLGQAERGFEDVLEARIRTIGIDHPKTLTTCHYLARVLARTGRTAGAETHLRRVVEARRHAFGPDNPHTLLAMDDLSRLVNGEKLSVHGTDAALRFRPDLASGRP